MILLLSMPSNNDGLLIFIAIGFFVLNIFYLNTLQHTLKAISIENRKTHPSNVWLLLIPIFSLIWQFIIIANIADSLKAEFNARKNLIDDARPGYNLGLVMSIFNCFLFVPFLFPTMLPSLNILIVIGTLIGWIIYWVKISKYKNLLENNTHSE